VDLPFGLELWQGGVVGLALLLAAFVRGYSGFGFSALLVACAGLVADPRDFIPVAILCEITMTLVQGRGLRGHIDWHRVWAMLLGAAVAMPLSVAVLSQVGVDAARVGISALIMAMCVLLLSGWAIRSRIGIKGHVGVGVASGLANGAAVGGLPVAAFMAAQAMPAVRFRATMVVYLTALDLMALPMMARAGMVSRDTGLALVLALPLLALGIFLGGRHFLAASPQGFRRMAISLLIGLALLGLLKSLL
jgi:uncharacterized membrane protein YfcA